MIDREKFYRQVRVALFGGTLKQSQVDGMNVILDTWESPEWQRKAMPLQWLADMLGTPYHETDKTMQPIEEYGQGRGLPYGRRVKMSGQPYTDTPAIMYGRGLVQLTWYENYDKAGKALGIDLLHKPELALQMQYAVPIMFYGMTEGWFTGMALKHCTRYNVAAGPVWFDWFNSRRIINGTDRAALVASYSEAFYSALR